MPTEKAIHEAGHAVAAAILGVPIKIATMDGVTTLSRKNCGTASWHECLIALSGIAAEGEAMNYTVDQLDEHLKDAWAQDIKNAERHLGSDELGLIMRQARWLMHDNRDAVEKVAKELEERGTLTGDEVTALLSR